MNLETTPLENAHVQLNIVMPHDREKLAKEEIIQSMWTWLPVIGTGTNYDTYYDLIMKQAKDGDLIPFRITRRVDGAFAGLVGFEAISRTHRRLRIGYAFHPPEMRGTVISPATQLALLERADAARFRRIEYQLPELNARAIGSVEKLGARREGVLRNYYRLAGGGWANVVSLSLVEGEIKAAILALRDKVKEREAA